MNVYLDIDGVLLTKDGNWAIGAVEFLEKVTAKHICYWLTTHCKGDAKPAIEHLQQKTGEEPPECLQKILPTNWGMLKTDAIDFDSEFVWLEDFPLESEKAVLRKEKAFDRLINIDLKSNPDQLFGVEL